MPPEAVLASQNASALNTGPDSRRQNFLILRNEMICFENLSLTVFVSIFLLSFSHQVSHGGDYGPFSSESPFVIVTLLAFSSQSLHVASLRVGVRAGPST